MKVIYTIILALLVMFIITFSLENTVPVRLKYFDYFQRWLPTYMLLFIAFLAGVIFTGFMGIVERFRLTRTISRLNKTSESDRKSTLRRIRRKDTAGARREELIITLDMKCRLC
jgi:uncharacterized integral membrane protein